MNITEIINHPDFVLGETEIISSEWEPNEWAVPIHVSDNWVICRTEDGYGTSIPIPCDENFQFYTEPGKTKTVTVYWRWYATHEAGMVIVESPRYRDKDLLIESTKVCPMVGPIVEEEIEMEVRGE